MDLQTATVVIAGISVIIGVINSILSSQRAAKNDEQTLETRQAQLYMQIYNRWNSREVTKAYGAVRYKYSEQEWAETTEQNLQAKDPDLDLDYYADHQMLGTFFEGLGILVKKNLVDLSLVEDLFAGRVIWYWETQLEPIAKMVKQYHKDSTLYDSIEYLYHEMKHRQRLTARP
jgi:hypothetical protein